MPQRSLVVSAVQMPFAWAVTPQEYFDRMRAPVALAASRGAQFVVLPQFTGDMLVGVMVPAEPEAGFEDLATRAGFASWQDCVRRTAETTTEFYVHTFESLAQRYHTYLVPGTISLPGEAEGSGGAGAPIYHAAFLFGPDGAVLGEQRQLFPSGEGDPATGYGAGLAPMDTAVGRIALVVGDDALHSELAASIVSLRCAVVANPVARRKTADVETARGRWRSVGEAGVYVVEAALVEGKFVGRSTIYGPVPGGGEPADSLVEAPSHGQPDQVIDAAITLR